MQVYTIYVAYFSLVYNEKKRGISRLDRKRGMDIKFGTDTDIRQLKKIIASCEYRSDWRLGYKLNLNQFCLIGLFCLH